MLHDKHYSVYFRFATLSIYNRSHFPRITKPLKPCVWVVESYLNCHNLPQHKQKSDRYVKLIFVYFYVRYANNSVASRSIPPNIWPIVILFMFRLRTPLQHKTHQWQKETSEVLGLSPWEEIMQEFWRKILKYLSTYLLLELETYINMSCCHLHS